MAACTHRGVGSVNDMGVFHDAAILAAHYHQAWGMSYGSPDRCSCGAQTRPAPGDEDVTVRRAQAFAEHQAKMLAAAREAN